MTDAIQKAREALVAAREALRADNMFTLSAKIDAALAALDAETEVKIKPLEWREHKGDEFSFVHYDADAVGGGYTIEERKHSCTFDLWHPDNPEGERHKTLEAAKAAAQADYERRIRSALVTPEARS